MQSVLECLSDRLCRVAAGFAVLGVAALMLAAALLCLAAWLLLRWRRTRAEGAAVPSAVPVELTTETASKHKIAASGGQR
ncbi:MAG: hypothetical protein U1A78_26595 [Polyangia bacterium]